MNVTIKHGGRVYPLQVDVDAPAIAFKETISSATGVPVDRMKVMVKGILKDDADLSKLGIKPNQMITVIGSSEVLPQAPVKPVVFLDDLDDSDLAKTTRIPPGLVNLGNTCYLNSTLQAIRKVPQLQTAMASQPTLGHGPEGRLTVSMKNLFSGMNQTTDAVQPIALIQNLRTLAPQFAEQDQQGHFAQQDADEAWTQLMSALRACVTGVSGQGSVVDDWMSLELTKTLSSPEAPNEQPTVSKEKVLKLECNISIQTNFLMSGIMDSLDQPIEKNSPTLGRSAQYNVTSRLSRLPAYLTVHMVRFYWRRDTQKKAKIMRKVKFPLQLDVLDITTDELREQLQPVNSAVKQILKKRDDRATLAKRAKGKESASDDKSEDAYRAEEREEIASLIGGSAASLLGTNPSGIYELCGEGASSGSSADVGHYIGWARRDEVIAPSGEEEWYKFDDDKVSIVTADKIQSMDGGGEDSVAYILLYRAINV